MKLNLGCGEKPLEGYVNVDAQPLAGVDVVHDLRLKLPFDDGSVEEIYAKHIIEHFSVSDWYGVLEDWVRVLASGGKLIIEAPDLSALAGNMLGNKFGLSKVWHRMMFGSDGPGMRHQRGVTIPWLHEDLTGAGLKVTRARKWHDDFPEHIDDPAWHYNLRVEAVKT